MSDTPEVVKGYNGFTEQPIKQQYKPGDPTVTTHTFLGPQAQADSFIQQLQHTYNITSLQVQRGVPCEIQLQTEEGFPGQQQDLQVLAEVTWKLDWEREMRDLKAHPWFDESGVAPETIEEIDLAIKKGVASKTDWNTKSGLSHMNDYRDCRLKGINSYIAVIPNLQAHLVMSRYTTLRTPAVPATKIISWGSIILPFSGAEAYTPAAGGIDQPKIHSCYAGGGGFQDITIDQWMVMPIKRGYSNNPKRYEIDIEWLGAIEWTGVLYDGGTGHPHP